MAALPIGMTLENAMATTPIGHTFTNTHLVAERLHNDAKQKFLKKIMKVPDAEVAQCRMQWSADSTTSWRRSDLDVLLCVLTSQRTLDRGLSPAEGAFMVYVPVASAIINKCDANEKVSSRERSYVLCKEPLTYTSVDDMGVTYEGYVLVPLRRNEVRSALSKSWAALTKLLCQLSARQYDDTDITGFLWRVAAMRQVARVKEVHDVSDETMLDTARGMLRVVTVPHLGSPHVLDMPLQLTKGKHTA